MKFMKLGSKPDSFQSNGENVRYVASELSTDIVVNVGDVKFYLHKFPLLSKSARLQKLVSVTNGENNDEIQIHDIPGGPTAFEICAKFCYGMVVTLNAYNVIAARCAAEYLEMFETIDKGNLIYKIEVFLDTSIFRTWKDSIIVLQTTKSLFPWSEELKVVSHCLDSIASKASIETSKVEWSYTYNRKKFPSENGDDPHYNGVRKQHMVPRDWWVEDLCELPTDLYKRVITTIKAKGRVPVEIIGESLKAYTHRKLPGFSKGIIQIKGGDDVKSRTLVETIIWLLPPEKRSVPCGFLLQLLQASILLECGEIGRKELMRKIAQQLEDAALPDILIRAPDGEKTIYNVNIVQQLVKMFLIQEQSGDTENEFQEIKGTGFESDSSSKLKVAKLVDAYLAEVARDPNLPLSKFIDLAEMISVFSRPSHDGLYRAVDMYLKEHPGISKSERKRICRLMDCRKLSGDARMHAIQNERLPLRLVVQILFFEQVGATTSSGGGITPDLQGPIRSLLPAWSHGSSTSATTNTEEDWDSLPKSEELKALRHELASLRLRDEQKNGTDATKTSVERAAANKVKGLLMSRRIFSKLWSGKDRDSENGSSDTSESACSTNVDETKSTPSRSGRHSSS